MSSQCPDKDKIPKSKWAIRRSETYLQALNEKETTNDETIEKDNHNSISHCTKIEWSGVQTSLENSNTKTTKMRNKIMLDTGSAMIYFGNKNMVKDLYHRVGALTVENSKCLLRTDIIQHCPVTKEDVKIVEDIFGPSMSQSKRVSTRKTPEIVRSDKVEIL